MYRFGHSPAMTAIWLVDEYYHWDLITSTWLLANQPSSYPDDGNGSDCEYVIQIIKHGDNDHSFIHNKNQIL